MKDVQRHNQPQYRSACKWSASITCDIVNVIVTNWPLWKDSTFYIYLLSARSLLSKSWLRLGADKQAIWGNHAENFKKINRKFIDPGSEQRIPQPSEFRPKSPCVVCCLSSSANPITLRSSVVYSIQLSFPRSFSRSFFPWDRSNGKTHTIHGIF